jgi:hypothetical protein
VKVAVGGVRNSASGNTCCFRRRQIMRGQQPRLLLAVSITQWCSSVVGGLRNEATTVPHAVGGVRNLPV